MGANTAHRFACFAPALLRVQQRAQAASEQQRIAHEKTGTDCGMPQAREGVRPTRACTRRRSASCAIGAFLNVGFTLPLSRSISAARVMRKTLGGNLIEADHGLCVCFCRRRTIRYQAQLGTN